MKNNKKFKPTVSEAPTEKLWNRVWSNNKKILFHEPVIYQITKLKSVSTVLEVGAGTGADLLELKRLGYEVTFSDFSSVAIKNINKINPQLTTIQCDARKLPFNKNSFDLVYCLGLLEHFNYSDRQKIISELFRVSKKYVLIDVPQANTITSLVKHTLMKIGKWKYGDEIEFSYKKLNNEVDNSTKENKNIYSVYGRELIPIPRNIKNKLYLKLPKLFREKHINLLNKVYYLCGCLGLIYEKQ